MRYGRRKEGRPLPIVQMGLFADRDGFRTDYQIVTRQKMRSIIAQTKKRERGDTAE